jgi:IMP dehydrogenase
MPFAGTEVIARSFNVGFCAAGQIFKIFLSSHMATRLEKSPKFFGEGLTFDDVLLVPAYSDVLPREVNIATQLTKDITLNIPLLSAAMDTVTEATLAIALAREGGIGILHKNMSIEQQAEQVRRVKRSESGLIIDPITLLEDATIADALRLMKENRIGGIPIVNAAKKLVGILTNRDLRFETNKKKKVSEVMTS